MGTRDQRTKAKRLAWQQWLRDQSGQNLVEYGQIVGLIALAVMASMTNMTNQLKASFSALGSALARYV